MHGDRKGGWVPPVRAELPVSPSHHHHSSSREVHFLTRGKQTHIVPCPLPTNISTHLPLRVLTWESLPTHIIPRVYNRPSDNDTGEKQPFLQLVALGEDGVEVQEISLSFLSKGKGKARADEPLRAEADVGGPTGFLCRGGHWDRAQSHYPFQPFGLARSDSVASAMSGTSFDSLTTDEIINKVRTEEGVYGWCQKGAQDWRVFWVGGHVTDEELENDNDASS